MNQDIQIREENYASSRVSRYDGMVDSPIHASNLYHEITAYLHAETLYEPMQIAQLVAILQHIYDYDEVPWKTRPKIYQHELESTVEQFRYFLKKKFLYGKQIELSNEKAQHALCLELDDAADVMKCISLLRTAGLENAADRMTCLKNLVDEDLDSDPLEINSVRTLAQFLIENQLPTDPEITASDDGLVSLSWMFGERGVLNMRFLTSKLVMFAAIRYDSDSKRYSISGTMTPDDAIMSAKPIYEKLFCL